MPRVARFQTTASSSSAIEMLKPWRSFLSWADDLAAVFERLCVGDFDLEN